MPDYQREAAYMGQTDGARAKLLDGTSDGAERLSKESKGENVVKEQIKENERFSEISQRWMRVRDAVSAAESACQKLKDDEGMEPEEAFSKAMADLMPVLEKIAEGDAEDVFGRMEEDARAQRIPSTA